MAALPLSPEANAAESSTRIKIDLEGAMTFMCSPTADRMNKGWLKGNAHRNGKTDRELMMTYLVRNITIDPEDHTVGYADVCYAPSKIGDALCKAKSIQGCRVYGGGSDPFSLSSRMNDVLTARHYDNWDDSKAYQRFMRLMTDLPGAQRVLDEFLADPDSILRAISVCYFSNSVVREHTKAAKQLLHMLSMDGTLDSWREKHEVPTQVQDHEFVTKYANAMKQVTQEFAQLPGADRALSVIELNADPNAQPKVRPQLTWKSYVLQHVEAGSRNAKLEFLRENKVASGSLEHDGVKCSKEPHVEGLQQHLTDAATQGAAKAAAYLKGVCTVSPS